MQQDCSFCVIVVFMRKAFASPVWAKSRLISPRPVNRYADQGVVERYRAKEKTKRPEGQRVYLVLFQLRSDPRVSFLKVGISAYDIRARFRSDLGLYKVSLLAESARFLGRDAETAEHAIHRAFHKSRVWPSVRLMSGNSECFAHTEANLRQFVDIVNAI